MKIKRNDPAYWMLTDGVESTPTVHDKDCYICNDEEYARMGLPLCSACPVCGVHMAADEDEMCVNNHYYDQETEKWLTYSG